MQWRIEKDVDNASYHALDAFRKSYWGVAVRDDCQALHITIIHTLIEDPFNWLNHADSLIVLGYFHLRWFILTRPYCIVILVCLIKFLGTSAMGSDLYAMMYQNRSKQYEVTWNRRMQAKLMMCCSQQRLACFAYWYCRSVPPILCLWFRCHPQVLICSYAFNWSECLHVYPA